MRALRRLGQRVAAGMRLGGRVLTSFGRAGTRVADFVGKGIDTVGSIPLIGGALVGSAPVQGLRGIVGGVATVSRGASGVGQILEKTGVGLSVLSS